MRRLNYKADTGKDAMPHFSHTLSPLLHYVSYRVGRTYVHEEKASHKAESLAVTNIRIQKRISLEDVEERQLASSKRMTEVRMLWIGPTCSKIGKEKICQKSDHLCSTKDALFSKALV